MIRRVAYKAFTEFQAFCLWESTTTISKGPAVISKKLAHFSATAYLRQLSGWGTRTMCDHK